MTTERADRLESRRNWLNSLILLLPGQWFGLMAVYWLRFLPPFRPVGFVASFPPIGLFLLGLAVCAVPFLLPKSYFRPKAFETAKLYRNLGLDWFRLLTTDGVLMNRHLRKFDPNYKVLRSRADLMRHLEGTYTNERWHTCFFIAGLLTTVHAYYTGQMFFGVAINLLNVVFNFFPILHQRYKRCRAPRCLSRKPAES